jgi:hypothetical protein
MSSFEDRVAEAPPLGLVPKKFHQEARLLELLRAMERYLEAGLDIPTEWVDEFHSLLSLAGRIKY